MSLKSNKKEKADSIYYRIIKDFEKGDISTAKLQTERLRKFDGESARIIDLEGLFAFHEQKFDQAEKFYKQAIELEPDKKEFQLNLGNLYMAKEEWEKAAEVYNDIAKKSPLYFPALNNLVMAQIRMEKKDEALVTLAKLKGFKPNYPYAYKMEAIIYYEKGDYEKALKAADKNIVLDPNNPETFQILGQIFNKQEKFEDAALAMKKAVDLDPDNIDNLVSLALAYGNIKRFDAAKPVLDKILKKDPKNKTALKAMQLLYTAAGNMEKADECAKNLEALGE